MNDIEFVLFKKLHREFELGRWREDVRGFRCSPPRKLNRFGLKSSLISLAWFCVLCFRTNPLGILRCCPC